MNFGFGNKERQEIYKDRKNNGNEKDHQNERNNNWVNNLPITGMIFNLIR